MLPFWSCPGTTPTIICMSAPDSFANHDACFADLFLPPCPWLLLLSLFLPVSLSVCRAYPAGRVRGVHQWKICKRRGRSIIIWAEKPAMMAVVER